LFLAIGLYTQTNFTASAEDYSNLKVTELNYHPMDIIDGTDTIYHQDDLEFIEFKNIGESSINLTGLMLDSAVYYEFPNDILLGPKQFWVVAHTPSIFFAFYGLEASGNYKGHFSNSSEEVLVHDAIGNKVIDFIYHDHSPWPGSPDGKGNTLVSVDYNPTGDPNNEAYWRKSLELYGSPFRDDDGNVDIKAPDMSDNAVVIYPNPANDYIAISLKGIDETQKMGVKIYTVNGSLVYQSDIFNNEIINLKALNTQHGLYFIQVETDKLIMTSKFIYN